MIGEVWGLNNATGKFSGYANGVNSRNAQVSLIVNKGIVYTTGEESYAIRVDGKGDVSDINTLWEGRMRTRFATPVLVDGHLFSVSGSVVADGKIYITTNSGTIHVIEAKPEFKVVGAGDMTFDDYSSSSQDGRQSSRMPG